MPLIVLNSLNSVPPSESWREGAGAAAMDTTSSVKPEPTSLSNGGTTHPINDIRVTQEYYNSSEYLDPAINQDGTTTNKRKRANSTEIFYPSSALPNDTQSLYNNEYQFKDICLAIDKFQDVINRIKADYVSYNYGTDFNRQSREDSDNCLIQLEQQLHTVCDALAAVNHNDELALTVQHQARLLNKMTRQSIRCKGNYISTIATFLVNTDTYEQYVVNRINYQLP